MTFKNWTPDSSPDQKLTPPHSHQRQTDTSYPPHPPLPFLHNRKILPTSATSCRRLSFLSSPFTPPLAKNPPPPHYLAQVEGINLSSTFPVPELKQIAKEDLMTEPVKKCKSDASDENKLSLTPIKILSIDAQPTFLSVSSHISQFAVIYVSSDSRVNLI